MGSELNVIELLNEYAEWRHLPPFHFPSPTTVEQRIKEMQENAGACAAGPRYDILEIDGESFATRPDGGLGNLIDRMGRDIGKDQRMRNFKLVLDRMPSHHRVVLEVVFHVGPRDRPRSEREAAAKLGINREAYRSAFNRMLGWIECAAGISAVTA